MNLFGPLVRGTALAGLLAISAVIGAPAQAAPADVQLLKSYLGSWKGTGKVSGARAETVRCNLNLTQGNQDKVNYNGKCVLAGSPMSVRGTLAYVDAANRFEARMTSMGSFDGVAVGRKQANGVLFNLKERGKDDEGNDLTVNAQILLQGGKIKVDFNVRFNETGDTLKASVPFSK